MFYFFNWIGGSRPIGDRLVSMNDTLGRIVIYRKTVDLIKKKTGQDPKFVKLGTTDECPNAFWIKPCAAGDKGALKVHAMGNTRMVSAKLLFSRLKEEGWYNPERKTDQFPADWDEDNKAIRIDLKKEPDTQE